MALFKTFWLSSSLHLVGRVTRWRKTVPAGIMPFESCCGFDVILFMMVYWKGILFGRSGRLENYRILLLWFLFHEINRINIINKRRWFSGRIRRCHRRDPGSIPGRRKLFVIKKNYFELVFFDRTKCSNYPKTSSSTSRFGVVQRTRLLPVSS